MSAQEEKRDATGRIRASQFRFSAETLAQLDHLVASAGAMQTRSSVLRRLIDREWSIREKNSRKSAPKPQMGD